MDCQRTVKKAVQNPFSSLSEDSISEILSRTSPADATRFEVLSKEFKSVSALDILWDKFVPMDIVSKLVSSPVYATKKELYLHLCSNPILLDDGKLSFSLDKKTGKKCFMVRAKEIINSRTERADYWKWKSNPDSRFGEVVELVVIPIFDIRGRINTRRLSQKTKYKAYLIFKLTTKINGIESMYSVVRLVNHEEDSEAEERAILLHPHRGYATQRSPLPYQPGYLPVRRNDGWMEIEMGEFYNDHGDDGDVEARLMEFSPFFYKAGLIVEGIEFRPNTSFDH